jgi:hypothetical protein
MTSHLEIVLVNVDDSGDVRRLREPIASPTVDRGELRDKNFDRLGEGWELFIQDEVQKDSIRGVANLSLGLLAIGVETKLSLFSKQQGSDRGEFLARIPANLTKFEGMEIDGTEVNAVVLTLRVK